MNDFAAKGQLSPTFRLASVDEAGVRQLIERHQALMQSTSPEESCHVMEPNALAEAGAVLVVAELDGQILGVGAFKDLGAAHFELKSMHTAQAARGKGVGRGILQELMQRAKADGAMRLSLETGSQSEFSAARTLYSAHGFELCAPFGDYAEDPLSVFMTRTL